MAKDPNMSPSQYQTSHEKNIKIPMRYGTTPRADITRPEAERRFPVLSERTLYNKEIGSGNAVGAAEYFASRGYVVIIQDVSGRFASEGDFYPFLDDGTGINRDGYDTVECLADQPWSNGRIGTIGGSHSGATQCRNALCRPPHLQAMFIRES